MIDTHCHLNDPRLFQNIEEALNKSRQENINTLINVSENLETSLMNLEIKNKFNNKNNILAGIGYHPHNADKYNMEEKRKIIQMLKKKEFDLIGEIGLDFYYNNSSKKNQIKVFEEFLNFSIEYDLAVSIHIREAYKQAIEILKNYYFSNKKIIIHCFSGGLNDLENLLKLNCYISYSGVITFKKAEPIRECLRITPRNRLLLETDSPYLAPAPFRGKTNYPYYVKYCYLKAGEIKQIQLNNLINIIRNNFNMIFK